MEKVKSNFLIFYLKKYFISIICLCFVIALVLYSNANFEAAKNGLKLWANSVVPSLFPFFVATELLCNTNLINLAGRFLKKPVQKLFGVPGEGAIAFIMGIISGYPTGAKIAVNFREKQICTKEEGERLLAFTNNSGPLFIIGTVGISMFASSEVGYILLISHIISCLVVGIVFKNWKNQNKEKHTFLAKNVDSYKEVRLKDFGEILGNSIKKSIVTILNIGGFIVIFSVVISILESSGIINVIQNIFGTTGVAIFSGIIEITNGISKISALGLTTKNIILTSFILGTGGISVLFQVYSVITKSDLSIKPYILGKILQAIISSLITGIILFLLQSN